MSQLTAESRWTFRVPPGDGPIAPGVRPTFSVIIPAYQSASTVGAAVASALAQTYRAREIIVCDDGSTDELAAVIARFGDRVTLLRRPHHGAGAARNAAIDAASGDFVVLLDADDVYDPDRLQALAELAAARSDLDILVTDAYFEVDGRVTGRFYQSNAFAVADQRTAILERCFFGWPAMRRTSVLAVDGFDESLAIAPAEDWDLFIRLILSGSRAGLVDHPLMRYRKHPGATTSNRARALRARAAVLEKTRARGDLSADEGRVLGQCLSAVRQQAALESRPRWATLPLLRRAARRLLPEPVYGWLRHAWRGEPSTPAPGAVRFGSLRRVSPISRRFGKDRGLPLDRYYIERFLSANARDIRGHVLEIGDDTYTRTFGAERVTVSDVLHVRADPRATIVADLTRGEHLPSGVVDCVILTQTLPCIYDVRAAVHSVHRILKPGGVALATVGGISQVARWDMERWGHYWSFTSLSVRRLFEDAFSPGTVTVASRGNVLAAAAFLYGLASEELRPEELQHQDPDYELIITVRAVKAPTAGGPERPRERGR
jgi:GT2 family glycosyltransferase